MYGRQDGGRGFHNKWADEEFRAFLFSYDSVKEVEAMWTKVMSDPLTAEDKMSEGRSGSGSVHRNMIMKVAAWIVKLSIGWRMAISSYLTPEKKKGDLEKAPIKLLVWLLDYPFLHFRKHVLGEVFFDIVL